MHKERPCSRLAELEIPGCSNAALCPAQCISLLCSSVFSSPHLFTRLSLFEYRKRRASDSIDDESHSSWTDVETRVRSCSSFLPPPPPPPPFPLSSAACRIFSMYSFDPGVVLNNGFHFQCSTAIEGRPGLGPSYCHTASKYVL